MICRHSSTWLDVGQKHGLVDDRIRRAFLLDHGFDGAEGIAGLLAERGAAAGNRGGKHVADVVQIDGRKAHALVDYLADHVRGHTNLLYSRVPNKLYIRRSNLRPPVRLLRPIAVCHTPVRCPGESIAAHRLRQTRRYLFNTVYGNATRQISVASSSGGSEQTKGR